MTDSLFSDYLTFLRVLGWAAATIVCWLTAGMPRLLPRRPGLALGMFCAAQMSFGVGGFFHYDLLSFGGASNGWLALAKLASFGFLREFARSLRREQRGSMISSVIYTLMIAALGLVAAGLCFPGGSQSGAQLGEVALLFLPLLICTDAIRQFLGWADASRERRGGQPGRRHWILLLSSAGYAGLYALWALQRETPALVRVFEPLVPWLLAGSLAWASLNAADVRGRLALGFAVALVGAAVAVPLAMRQASPGEQHTILLAGGLGIIFCAAGFGFAWWQTLAAELQLTVAKREAASRAKTDFLAFLGHELRTPLQAILGRTELLRDEDGSAAQKAALATIATEGKVMLNLVNDLLDLGAIEGGRFELRSQPFSLRGLIAMITEIQGALARAKGLEFEFTVAPDVPDRFLGDATRWRQILGNLLGNAVKYTVAGRVELGVTRLPVRVGDPRNAVRLRFVVRDTGIGLPSEKIARLFTMFTRLDEGGAMAREGAGVGLALVKRLVDLMGGTVTAANRTDWPGAEFTVNLVVSLAPEDSPPQAVVAAVRTGTAGLGVLVVEDHPAAREVLADFLRSLGHRPTAVADGIMMWAALAAQKFDAVVLDVNLPGTDGVRLAAELARRRDSQSRLRIIGCSADAQAETRTAALTAGMDEFLSKPVSRAELAFALDGIQPAKPDLFELMRADDLAVDARQSLRVNLPAECVALRGAAEACDWNEVRRRAHYLRNSALVLGEIALAAAAQAVEYAAKQEDATTVETALQEIADSAAKELVVPAPDTSRGITRAQFFREFK